VGTGGLGSARYMHMNMDIHKYIGMHRHINDSDSDGGRLYFGRDEAQPLGK